MFETISKFLELSKKRVNEGKFIETKTSFYLQNAKSVFLNGDKSELFDEETF